MPRCAGGQDAVSTANLHWPDYVNFGRGESGLKTQKEEREEKGSSTEELVDVFLDTRKYLGNRTITLLGFPFKDMKRLF